MIKIHDIFGMDFQEVAGREEREEGQGEQDGWRRELQQLRTTQSHPAGLHFTILVLANCHKVFLALHEMQIKLKLYTRAVYGSLQYLTE
jgi:hypothetical protein